MSVKLWSSVMISGGSSTYLAYEVRTWHDTGYLRCRTHLVCERVSGSSIFPILFNNRLWCACVQSFKKLVHYVLLNIKFTSQKYPFRVRLHYMCIFIHIKHVHGHQNQIRSRHFPMDGRGSRQPCAFQETNTGGNKQCIIPVPFQMSVNDVSQHILLSIKSKLRAKIIILYCFLCRIECRWV